jgi:hypothetical protein
LCGVDDFDGIANTGSAYTLASPGRQYYVAIGGGAFTYLQDPTASRRSEHGGDPNTVAISVSGKQHIVF